MKTVTFAVGVVLGLFAISFFASLPVFLLWNGCLVGAVSGVNEVTWLQAWGISFLCSLLFKSSSTTSK